MTYQKGFAHAFLIIGLVVAFVGALGFIFWQNFIHEKPVVTKTETQVVKKPVEAERIDPNEGYVVVDDWNVRFKASVDLSGTEVTYSERGDETNGVYYAFSTKRIKQLGGKCSEQPFGDTAILGRSKEKPIATPDGELVSEEALNGYYYILTSPIASCSGFNEGGEMQTPSQIEVDDRAALKESIRKLESLSE